MLAAGAKRSRRLLGVARHRAGSCGCAALINQDPNRSDAGLRLRRPGEGNLSAGRRGPCSRSTPRPALEFAAQAGHPLRPNLDRRPGAVDNPPLGCGDSPSTRHRLRPREKPRPSSKTARGRPCRGASAGSPCAAARLLCRRNAGERHRRLAWTSPKSENAAGAPACLCDEMPRLGRRGLLLLQHRLPEAVGSNTWLDEAASRGELLDFLCITPAYLEDHRLFKVEAERTRLYGSIVAALCGA